MGRRSLKNLCLAYLSRVAGGAFTPLVVEQFERADNMSDEFTALAVITGIDCPERDALLDRFYQKWREDTLVLNKWFGTQARDPNYGSPATISRLMAHEAFDIKNPNKVRALLGAFAHGNALRFHEGDGSGYSLIADQILRLDELNPQVAARLAGAFNRWAKYEPKRRELMQRELGRVLAASGLSRNSYEIVSKALKKDTVTETA
jgi:aminopeptidase N